MALSYYYFQRRYGQIRDDYPLESYVEDDVNGTIGSAEWGTWQENVASGVTTRGKDPNFLLLRYEDMIEDTARELRRLASFLNITASEERIQQVIEFSAASRLRKLEREDAQVWVGTKNRRQDIPMIRAATSGGWRQELPEPALQESNRHGATLWGSSATSCRSRHDRPAAQRLAGRTDLFLVTIVILIEADRCLLVVKRWVEWTSAILP